MKPITKPQSTLASQPVRGSALKEKIAQSEEYGKKYRAEHQGADEIKSSLPQDQKAESKEHSSRKNN